MERNLIGSNTKQKNAMIKIVFYPKGRKKPSFLFFSTAKDGIICLTEDVWSLWRTRINSITADFSLKIQTKKTLDIAQTFSSIFTTLRISDPKSVHPLLTQQMVPKAMEVMALSTTIKKSNILAFTECTVLTTTVKLRKMIGWLT